jgi:hypothetical protein
VTEVPVQRQRRIAQRLTSLIAALDATAVPSLLIRHQARLRLTSNELVHLLRALTHRRDNSCWPWLAVNDVASATGSAARSVKDWRTVLVTRGCLALSVHADPSLTKQSDSPQTAVHRPVRQGADQLATTLPAADVFGRNSIRDARTRYAGHCRRKWAIRHRGLSATRTQMLCWVGAQQQPARGASQRCRSTRDVDSGRSRQGIGHTGANCAPLGSRRCHPGRTHPNGYAPGPSVARAGVATAY